ncbi:hypothetical protein BKA60DRAFT_193578 [Fusarium oxysporum]|nr:hypothetical protein BKA60DRAFT_193578 [Fusarium oxysporum]
MYPIMGEKWGYPNIQIDPNRSKSIQIKSNQIDSTFSYPNQIKLGLGFDLIYLFASLLDARQWRVLSGESDPIADATGSHSTERDGSQNAAVYRPDGIGTAARLIDVLRNAITRTVITAASKEISAIVEQMFQFQETALTSEEDLNTAIILNDDLSPLRGTVSSTGTPGQEQLRAIKSQQISLSREREKAIQGDAELAGRYDSHRQSHSARRV